jgi:hypothetical protein
VRAIDPAGNIDPVPANCYWVIDLVLPETVITSSSLLPYPYYSKEYPGPLRSNSSSVTFEFTCNEEPCTFECQIDNSEWLLCASPKTFTDLLEGNHTFNVRAIDLAGNRDSTPATETWITDFTPPDTTITSYPPDPDYCYCVPGEVPDVGCVKEKFEFECNEEYCDFQCEMDGEVRDCGGGASPKGSISYTCMYLSTGTHVFRVFAVDVAGNADSTPALYTWTLY